MSHLVFVVEHLVVVDLSDGEHDVVLVGLQVPDLVFCKKKNNYNSKLVVVDPVRKSPIPDDNIADDIFDRT